MQILIYMITTIKDKYFYDKFHYSSRMIDLEFVDEISNSIYTQSHDLKALLSYYLNLIFQQFQIISSLRTYRVGDENMM
jgi:hypothetical protein